MLLAHTMEPKASSTMPTFAVFSPTFQLSSLRSKVRPSEVPSAPTWTLAVLSVCRPSRLVS